MQSLKSLHFALAYFTNVQSVVQFDSLITATVENASRNFGSPQSANAEIVLWVCRTLTKSCKVRQVDETMRRQSVGVVCAVHGIRRHASQRPKVDWQIQADTAQPLETPEMHHSVRLHPNASRVTQVSFLLPAPACEALISQHDTEIAPNEVIEMFEEGEEKIIVTTHIFKVVEDVVIKSNYAWFRHAKFAIIPNILYIYKSITRRRDGQGQVELYSRNPLHNCSSKRAACTRTRRI